MIFLDVANRPPVTVADPHHALAHCGLIQHEGTENDYQYSDYQGA